MSSIVLDVALERVKSPFVIRWRSSEGWILLKKSPWGGPTWDTQFIHLGASYDRAQVIAAYNEYVRNWQSHANDH